MSSETTTTPFGYCSKCGRPLTHPRSNAHGMGPCCWQKHLDSLSEDERARESMRGYNWFKAGDLYIVVAPEHHAYQVDPNAPACECIAFTTGITVPCKHIEYLRRETGWTAPNATESRQDGQEIASTLTIDRIDDQYANVSEGARTYYVNWVRPHCSCPSFLRTHEICPHIRAAQDEAYHRAQANHVNAEAVETWRAHMRAEIEKLFDEF